MYFLFLISVFGSVQNVSDINELNKLKYLLNENDSRKSIEEKVYEFLNINLSTNFGTVLETSDINELNVILRPLLGKDDSIKSVNDELYKFFNNRNVGISLYSSGKENHLEIQFNDIKNNLLPECLGRLIYINVLILEDNNLSELPEFFRKFTSLYRLDLSSNKFKKIPKVIFSLKNLIHLDLSMNKIESIENDIEILEQLQFLDVSGNDIKIISEKLKNLTALIYLDLSLNVNIIRISVDAMDITDEREVLRAIPISVKCLYLIKIGLKYIPCDLIFPNLYILDVSNNLLKDLSLCSIKCFNIWVAHASSNYLTSMTQGYDEFKELRQLNLQDNRTMELVFIKKHMFSALEELDLRDCNIKQFEIEGYNIMDSSNGEYINHGNPNINDSESSNNASNKDNGKSNIIYSLKTLSITITNTFVIPNLLVFPKLLDLNITNKDYCDNDPDTARSHFDGLSEMEDLRKLNLVGFNLVAIPPAIFRLKSLESLILNICKLKKISNKITELSNLKNVNLYDNYIDNINPKIFEFKESINIRLGRNPFIYLPSDINNDELKFNLTIDRSKVAFFKKDENNLGAMDISYKKIHEINASDILCSASMSINELYDEAHKEEEHKWELKRILEIKQRTVKESQNDYNVIIDYWNTLEEHITNNDIKEKFSNYIKVLYENKERMGTTNSIKNYLEAIFEILKNLVNTEDTNIVETILNKIEPGLSKHMDNQLVHFSYAYYFLVDNFKESNYIEHCIENEIASLKYHALKEITISNIDDIDVFLYWQNELSNTLGLPIMSEKYYLSTSNGFLKCKEYIIYQFFKLITVKNVVKDLYESINKNHERIMMAYKYISDNNDIENLQEYIEYEGDIKHKNIRKVTEEGIYFILKKMNLITSGEG